MRETLIDRKKGRQAEGNCSERQIWVILMRSFPSLPKPALWNNLELTNCILCWVLWLQWCQSNSYTNYFGQNSLPPSYLCSTQFCGILRWIITLPNPNMEEHQGCESVYKLKQSQFFVNLMAHSLLLLGHPQQLWAWNVSSWFWFENPRMHCHWCLTED